MRYDVAVIGAGSAGAIVAARLAETGAQVALVEAGPDYPDLALLPDELKYGRATAAYATVHGHLWPLVARATERQAPAPLPRGRVVGGTSAVNGQVFLRGLRDDFRRWAEDAGGWGFDDVLPAFRRLERDLDFDDEWHGTDGPIAVRRYNRDEWLPAQAAFHEACRTAGYAECPDANRPDAAGVGAIPFNNVGGLRASTAVAYLADARRLPNLAIHADTLARRLRVHRGRVTGVELLSGSDPAVLEADEIVVSAGAIGSPHLLLLSGIGPAAQLARAGVEPHLDLPGVGAGLRDHQLVDLVWEVEPDPATAASDAPRVQVALRYTSSASPAADDMQITVRTSAPGRSGESVVSLAPCIELSDSAGELTLVSADPDVQPAIELRFLSAAADRRRLVEGVRLCLELATAEPLAGLLRRRLAPEDAAAASDAALERWLLEHVRTSHHCYGTCRMGAADEPGTVVDAAGRVHGLENLRVADASILPPVLRANLNATTMMVGERIAELVRRELA